VLKEIEQSAGAAFPVRLSHMAGGAGGYSSYTYLVLPMETRGQTDSGPTTSVSPIQMSYTGNARTKFVPSKRFLCPQGLTM
jgi:hypothetical protein